MDELNEEGRKLWEQLADDGFAKGLKVPTRKKAVTPAVARGVTADNMRLEIRKLQQNSIQVVREAKVAMEQYTKQERYFCANECKTAVYIHSNFVVRLQRILEGLPAFDHQVDLPEDYGPPGEDLIVFVR